MIDDRIEELLKSVRARQMQIRESMAELERRQRAIKAEATRRIREALDKSKKLNHRYALFVL